VTAPSSAERIDPMASLLDALGEVLRERRHALGLTQAELAARSHVSLRFLGQLETGQGNISVERLASVAEALSVPLSRLFSQAENTLSRRSSIAQPRVRVALLGVRGAGKSTIGKLLAERLHVPFVELDALVEKRAGLGLSALFELHGESHFRRLEREALAGLLGSMPSFVVATGGSLVTDHTAYETVRSTCTTVWLQATAEDHWNRVIAQGDGRPMRKNPRAMDQLRELLKSRTPLYEQAEVVVNTTRLGPDDIVGTLVDRLVGR
jgi:XRE family transcriptional regulator, aerobic/anaerobic benzoate catabolism transcriptional regulator